MQNELLPEEKPEYQKPAPTVHEAESALATETTAEDALTTAEVQTRLLGMKRSARRRVYGFILTVLALVVLPSVIIPALFGSTSMAALRGILTLLVIVAGVIISAALGRKETRRLPQYLQIAREGGAAAVGPLLEMRRDNLTPANGSAIDAALALCLPQMKAADARLLDAAQRRLLPFLRFAPIGEKPDAARTDFRVAALQALTEIGEASDLPLVESTAGLDAKTADTVRVRDAAQACLPLLKIRLGLIADAKTLLRASAPEEEGGGTLLRPAAGPSDADPKELLRPSDGGA